MRRSAPLVGFVVVMLLATGGVAVASHDFADVPDTHAFHDDISWLVDAQVTEGFADGTYGPGRAVTRGSMAAFLRRLAGGDPAVPPVVNAARLSGRTATDFDDAITLQGQTPTQLLPNYNAAGEDLITVVGTSAGSANLVAAASSPQGSLLRVDFSAMVDTSHESLLLTCQDAFTDETLPGMNQIKVGTVAGYADRVNVSTSFLVDDPGLAVGVSCFASSKVGPGIVNVVDSQLIATQLL